MATAPCGLFRRSRRAFCGWILMSDFTAEAQQEVLWEVEQRFGSWKMEKWKSDVERTEADVAFIKRRIEGQCHPLTAPWQSGPGGYSGARRLSGGHQEAMSPEPPFYLLDWHSPIAQSVSVPLPVFFLQRSWILDPSPACSRSGMPLFGRGETTDWHCSCTTRLWVLDASGAVWPSFPLCCLEMKMVEHGLGTSPASEPSAPGITSTLRLVQDALPPWWRLAQCASVRKHDGARWDGCSRSRWACALCLCSAALCCALRSWRLQPSQVPTGASGW